MATQTDQPLQQSVQRPQGELGPIPGFDHHLKVLSDSYISFVSDRIKIEEAYVENLRRLHNKAKAIDGYLDDRSELGSTTRRAWREVRDNVEREAESRYAFVNTLRSDVLQQLYHLRETQERTKKRIREDVTDAITAHADYAENVLPRLKRAYLKRCQDADEHKSSSLSPTSPSSTTDSTRPQRANTMSSPSPTRPAGRPISQQMAPRNRSPSTAGNTFSDLAHQGKKGLHQLKGLLDGKAAGTNGPSGRAENALKGVRAKREADEADKEYRKGIHWLETLRLRRVKTVEAGYSSLETFVRETAETVKKCFVLYVDNILALSTSNCNFSEHALKALAEISPDKDLERVHNYMAPSLRAITPKRVLYHNYSVGDCRDLIFGVGLVDYANSRGLADDDVPRLVRLCVREIEERGLDCEGIFRISGRHANVQELVHKIEKDERNFKFNPQTDDVYCVSSLLKQYLRELADPLFRFPLNERLQYSDSRDEHVAKDFAVLRSKLRRLPAVHHATLKIIVELLQKISARSATNKMDAKNLAIVFAAVVFGEDKLPDGGDVLSLQTSKDTVMEDLITNAHTLFDDRPAGPASPALPPRPMGEEQAPYPYGSSHTHVASIPARKSIDSLSSAASSSEMPSASEDFAPQFSGNPSSSIHPSRRGNALYKTSSVSSHVGSSVAEEDEIPPPAEGQYDTLRRDSRSDAPSTTNAIVVNEAPTVRAETVPANPHILPGATELQTSEDATPRAEESNTRDDAKPPSTLAAAGEALAQEGRE